MQDLESLSKEDLLAKVEELLKEVKSLKRQKKFGLVWEDKPEKVATDCEKMLPVVEEVVDKTIEKAGDKPANIIIEGDNYHALSVLNCTHAGKIDVIYIDPPYNTGNKDFRYNDNYVDKEDSYRHSKWLSFMSKRLALAKNLLSDTGVIFISIDDNEQAWLRCLCNEIFGERNLITQFIWKKKTSGGQGAKHSLDFHEYILCYAKDILNVKNFAVQRSEKQKQSFKYKDEFYSERGAYLLSPLQSWLDYRPNLIYPIEMPDGSSITGVQWTHGRESFERLKEDGRIEFKKTKKGWTVYKKQYERDKLNGVIPPSILDIAQSSHGTKELRGVFGKKVFSNPKPTELIRLIIEMVQNKDALVLDFFAGSGTTGHATLKANQLDGGRRYFILCTNNEGDIAEEVTYPRIKTVITGKRQDGSKYSDGIPANVRYFKTTFVDKGQSNDDARENLIKRATDIFRIKENTFKEELCTDNFRVYSGGKKIMTVVFDPFELKNIWPEIESIYNKIGADNIRLYIFSYSSDVTAFTDEIPQDTKVQWEAMPIPEGILATYKKLFKEVK